ncbi:hypothetical protein IQ13_1025 [Lacibacter cauensis]|uniref:RNA polymerase alpha subunit n=1 Tax=Lacibacter cauensis TaxID=510947 RepID=A0A562SYT0_9BACT|nr:hypothetical protein [Lacibacter cauensis]TWI85856.1 hypothetical protein IQ13_1025 [Lacibacter cauensis]
MDQRQNDFLNKKVESLTLNSDLIELLTFHGYHTLGDVLEKEVSYLRNRNGLTLHDELELYKIVNEYGLMELWKG